MNDKHSVDSAIKELVTAFPAAFTLDPTLVRPLKLGIRDDLYGQSDISHRRIGAALRSYCNSVNYLAAHTGGAERVDLAGKPAGIVTAAEAEHARIARVATKRGSKAAAGPKRATQAPNKAETGRPADTVAKAEMTMHTGKTTTMPAATGARRLTLADLRQAAAARKAAR